MSISLDEEAIAFGSNDGLRLLNSLPGLVWTTDETGALCYANSRFTDFTGLVIDQGGSRQWASFLHPDDHLLIVPAQKGGVQLFAARLRRRDGQFEWFNLSASAMKGLGGEVCWLATERLERIDNQIDNADRDFRSFLDSLSLQALLLTPSLELEFANQAAWRWYGLSSGAQVQDRSAHFNLSKLKEIAFHLQAGQNGNEPAVVSYQALSADGTLRWLEAQVVQIRTQNGELAGYCVLQTDVQDSRESSHLLAQEMEILEMIARGAPSASVLQRLCDVVADLVPDLVCGFLELSLDRKLFRMGAVTRLPGEFREIFDGKSVVSDNNPCSTAALTKRTVEIANLAESDQRETSMGEIMLANGLNYCQAIPILSPYGNTAGIFAILRHQQRNLEPREQRIIDRAKYIAAISIDRTRHEEALVRRETQVERSQAQLVAAQRISSTGSFTSDIQRDENIWSEEFYRIFDLDPELEPSIDAVRERVHPEDLELFDFEMKRGFAGEDADLVFRIIRTDASVRYIRGLARATHYIGDHPVFMGTVQDITETRRAEDALRRGEEALLKAREELAYVSRVMTISALTTSIAHEVSQPLSGILANANACVRLLALDPPNIASATDTARRTIRDTMRATEVIKRLRAMFNRQSPAMEEIDLNEIAREVIALSTRDMREKFIVLEAKLTPELPSVIGDRIQLQQVILNMVLNGIEAIAEIEGRPRRLLVRTVLAGEGMLTLSILDAGVGIAADAADKMFEPFFTTKRNGMGIGLSISRSIIENHGGRMWAMPNDGPGATVAFSLPSLGKPIDRSAT
ncbi:histidine kinase [Rhizobium sp. R72]|uniref:PAS domain-containing sensor histidine kinase n=1 Tax=unclassified Rhizobium TaxID=2613769 RepID=UPI000B52B3B5|nr:MULTISPECIES: ATP-binding protein [unclassified Rhizobium]OWV98936.1 histidine kinase [Rhizobium sp. R72]OWV98987.1 histidine kinase [Rhizobium sp. R711]